MTLVGELTAIGWFVLSYLEKKPVRKRILKTGGQW
jgi:hypothetical protein